MDFNTQTEKRFSNKIIKISLKTRRIKKRKPPKTNRNKKNQIRKLDGNCLAVLAVSNMPNYQQDTFNKRL